MKTYAYYKKYYNEIKSIILSDLFLKNSQRNIDIINLVSANDLKKDFDEINSYYGFFIKVIEHSESRDFSIEKTYNSFLNINWTCDPANLKTYALSR